MESRRLDEGKNGWMCGWLKVWRKEWVDRQNVGRKKDGWLCGNTNESMD
jgi:hypothetical protein